MAENEPPSLCCGVRNKKYPIPAVGGANGGSWNAVPLRIKPDLGKVAENSAKPPAKQCCDVFHERELRSNFANKTGILAPEAGAFAFDPGALAGITDVLAGEPAADDIDPPDPIGSKSSSVDGSDVVIAGDLRPMLRQNSAAIRVDFAERDRAESAGAFET